jgi:hypothetical protein
MFLAVRDAPILLGHVGFRSPTKHSTRPVEIVRNLALANSLPSRSQAGVEVNHQLQQPECTQFISQFEPRFRCAKGAQVNRTPLFLL